MEIARYGYRRRVPFVLFKYSLMQINRLTLNYPTTTTTTNTSTPYAGSRRELFSRSHVPYENPSVYFNFFSLRRWFRYFYIVSTDQRSFFHYIHELYNIFTRDNGVDPACVRKIIRRVSHCGFLPYILRERRHAAALVLCRFSVIFFFFIIFILRVPVDFFATHLRRSFRKSSPFTTPVVSSPPDTCFMLWWFYTNRS